MMLDDSRVHRRRLKRIEDKFAYVNLIFDDLAGLVDHQAAVVSRLEQNTANVLANSSKAHTELKTAVEGRLGVGRRGWVLGMLGLLALMWLVLISRDRWCHKFVWWSRESN